MLKNILKNNPSLLRFVFILSGLNFILFHYPFFQFVLKNVDYKTFNGILLLSSLVVAVLIVNAFIFYLILIQNRWEIYIGIILYHQCHFGLFHQYIQYNY
jgi:lipid A ethanolaminephosphotransferase